MPNVPLDPAQKREAAFNYPRLFLEKGESARILLIEPEPLFEYVHTLRMEEINEEGEVVMETVQKFGREVTQPKKNFVGRHICIGDYETIANKGSDANSCPVCAAAAETDAVAVPERRFAAHVFKYATRPGSFEVAEPFTGQLVAWAFGDSVFNQLVDFAQEWGDLRKHDLLLGPCIVRQFQRFDINIAGKAEWLAEGAEGAPAKLVRETYANQQSKDLSTMIGRRISRELVEQDLQRVLQRHKEAMTILAGGVVLPDEEEKVTPDEVESLLDGVLDEPTPTQAEVATSDVAVLTEPNPVSEEQGAVVTKEPEKSAEQEEIDFDELTKFLNAEDE